MEGIDLAGVVDSDFQGIQINFAPPRPAPQDLPIFTGRGGAGQDLIFCGAGLGGAALFPRGGAGWGGAHIPGPYNKDLLFDSEVGCCVPMYAI